ncbi:unnamed protein product, partial [Ectocarpus sp. 4 AP-2014]
GETDASTFSAAIRETSLSEEIILGRTRKQERISPTAAKESQGQESGELSVPYYWDVDEKEGDVRKTSRLSGRGCLLVSNSCWHAVRREGWLRRRR